LLLTLVNLRGVREAGGVFMLPTWLFVICLMGTIVLGVRKVIASGGQRVYRDDRSGSRQ
jgi:amino acid transporter